MHPKYPSFTDTSGGLSDETAVTLVDVGGGRGQFLETYLQQNPSAQGRFILQDLPSVVKGLSNKNFEVVPHDFFGPQPIVGARFYHFRRILHDWSDKECLSILKNTRPAIVEGKSTILINDIVTPEEGCPEREALLDLNMMVVTGMERTKTQWEALLNEAGFTILSITKADVGAVSIIEAGLIKH